MKVALVGVEGDFTKNAADGVKRYMYELYDNLRRLSQNNIQKLEYKRLPLLYSGFSAFPQSLFSNPRVSIIHNLEPKPILPLNKDDALLLTTIHDFHGLLRPEKEDYDSLRRRLGLALVLRFGLNLALKFSDYLICNSTQTKAEAITFGFDKRKIFITALGVDGRFIKTYPKSKDNKLFRVGYIGSLSTTKNVAFAINAFLNLKNDGMQFEIWGKQDRTYLNLVNLAKNDKHIKFLGYAPENRIVHIYDSFDVFVHPSLYEGFGLPILEAQARGLPVIIYKYGKIPKEVRKYCFEAESHEHMAQIIEDLKKNGYNEKLRKRATAYARGFTWEKTAKETLEMYKKALE